MAVETIKADGMDVTLESSLFRDRVYIDGAQKSEVTTLRPALSRVHAFLEGTPPVRFEVRTYGVSGYAIVRDGRLLASRRPGWVFGALFVALGLVKWLEFAVQQRGVTLVSALLFTIAGIINLLPFWGWSRLTRQWPRDASNPATSSGELR